MLRKVLPPIKGSCPVCKIDYSLVGSDGFLILSISLSPKKLNSHLSLCVFPMAAASSYPAIRTPRLFRKIFFASASILAPIWWSIFTCGNLPPEFIRVLLLAAATILRILSIQKRRGLTSKNTFMKPSGLGDKWKSI